MKLKNFRLHNKEIFHFIARPLHLPFFNRGSASSKRFFRFTSDHSPNAFIPPPERRRNLLNWLKIIGRAETHQPPTGRNPKTPTGFEGNTGVEK